jgi:peptidyl-prolyl cis-trans isomerase B (cyclophilin B)
MLKRYTGLLVAAAFLAGCDHKTASHQPATAPGGDSAFTGVPAQPLDSFVKTPPRAALVALPPASSQPVSAAASTPPPAEAPDSAPVLATSAPMPARGADSPGSLSLPAPATSDNSSDSGQPAVNPSIHAAPLTNMPPVDPNQVVAIQTKEGQIVIELDDFAAPRTCKNFRQLINDGFYNNTVFHRVIPNFIIQGGDPNSKTSATNREVYGLGGPGYTLPAEISLKHDRGAVAMARLPDSVNPQRESNGSQFYICLAACPSLDDQYTVFGHVIKGLDVAEKISEESRDHRDNPLKRIEMTMSLEPKDQALGNSSAANP